jgi:hypothetical protein
MLAVSSSLILRIAAWCLVQRLIIGLLLCEQPLPEAKSISSYLPLCKLAPANSA